MPLRHACATAIAVLAGLSGCAAPSGTCSLALATAVPLDISDDPSIAVSVGYGGRALKMIVDTGSETTMLDEALLRVGDATYDSTEVVGIGGSRGGQLARLRQITIGALHGNVSAVASSLDFAKRWPGMAGLLGMNILRQYDIDLDIGGGSLRFLRPFGDCAGRVPTNLTGDIYAVDEIRDDADNPNVPVTIDGVKLIGELDTGSDSVVLSRQAGRRLGLTEAILQNEPASTDVGIGRREVKGHRHMLRQLQLGDLTIQNVPAIILPDNLGDVDVLLGLPLALKIHFWLANSAHQLLMQFPPRNSPPMQ